MVVEQEIEVEQFEEENAKEVEVIADKGIAIVTARKRTRCQWKICNRPLNQSRRLKYEKLYKDAQEKIILERLNKMLENFKFI